MQKLFAVHPLIVISALVLLSVGFIRFIRLVLKFCKAFRYRSSVESHVHRGIEHGLVFESGLKREVIVSGMACITMSNEFCLSTWKRGQLDPISSANKAGWSLSATTATLQVAAFQAGDPDASDRIKTFDEWLRTISVTLQVHKD